MRIGIAVLAVVFVAVTAGAATGATSGNLPVQQLTPVAMAAMGAPAAVAADGSAAGPLDYDGQIAAARTLVTQDPARVAQLVKTWVGDDE